MAEQDLLRVEVAYAEAQHQFLRALTLPAGACVRDAIAASGVYEAFPHLDASPAIGIWSRLATPETLLRDGDRVELYRPLQVDPKEVRRQRARTSPIARKR